MGPRLEHSTRRAINGAQRDQGTLNQVVSTIWSAAGTEEIIQEIVRACEEPILIESTGQRVDIRVCEYGIGDRIRSTAIEERLAVGSRSSSVAPNVGGTLCKGSCRDPFRIAPKQRFSVGIEARCSGDKQIVSVTG